MRYLLALLILLFPTFVLASCSSEGSTVFYVNGINTTKLAAGQDLENLRLAYINNGGDKSVKFFNAYNQTNGEFFDVWKALAHMLAWDTGTWNEDVTGSLMLDQIHNDLTTQKVELVGYSEGSVYANETYKYLTTQGGMSATSVKNFDVGTPASYVAGGGAYMTSTNDTIIAKASRLAVDTGLQKPLPANVTISEAEDPSGHLFSQSYLAGAETQIVDQVQSDVASLEPTSPTDTADCFIPPSGGMLHKTAVVTSSAAASLGTVAYLLGASTLNGTMAAVGSAFDAAGKIADDIKTTIGGIDGLAHAGDPGAQNTNLNVVQHLYGGANEHVDGQTLHDLLSQGGAAILATIDMPVATPTQPADNTPPTPQENTPVVPIGPAPGVSPGGGGPSAPQVITISEAPQAESTVSSTEDDASSTPQADADALAVDTSTSTTTDATTTPPDPASTLPSADVLNTMTGFYCDGDTSVLLPGNTYTYRPTHNNCHYLVGFATQGWTGEADLLDGVVGSSTVVTRVNNGGSTANNREDQNYDLVDAQSGKTYTVVFFAYYNNVGGNFNAYYVGDMEHYLETGYRNDGVTDSAPYSYQSLTVVLP